jgi:TolB-like protein/Tfp pilus assembly protein PilF
VAAAQFGFGNAEKIRQKSARGGNFMGEAEPGKAGETAPRLTLFFSYSRTDQKQALPLIRALEQQGHAVWWDGLLEGGDNFLPTTQAALETADVVVVVWSKTSIDSHWVRDEATVGRDRRRLVPLSIDGSLPPLGFRQFQVIDFARWNGKASAPEVQRVQRAIAAVSSAPANASGAPAGGSARPLVGSAAPAAGSATRRNLLIGGLFLAGGGGLAAWRWLRPGAAAEAANSVAVLPFRNLSGRADQDYFAEGIAEELRTTLSLNRQLLVSGSASAGGFRSADPDARQIAQALGVANLLMGAVRPGQGRVRITARLVDGQTGLDSWSQAFDRDMADVLAVQAEIATTVADALISTLAKDDDWQAQRPGSTGIAAAFDAYAKGEALYRLSGSQQDDEQALAAIDKAITLDPDYAAAHAARARTLVAIANQEDNMARAATLRRDALASARQAITLAPTMPEAHAALGFVLMSQLDFSAAKPAYQRSFDLGLGNASILSAFAEFAGNIGDFGPANAAMRRAERLDPLNPAVFRNAGMLALAARDYPAARAALDTALSLSPRLAIVHRALGDMALVSGDAAEARRHYALEPSRLSRLRGLAITDAKLSGPAAGEAQMARLVAEFGDGGLYQQVQVLAQWGRTDAALAALDKALLLRDSGLVLALNDPLLDPLRAQPRFKAVLARLGVAT